MKNTFPLTLVLGVTVLGLCPMLVGGCRQEGEHTRLDTASMSPEDRAGLLPPEVQMSIGRDHPGAKIKRVEKERHKNGAVHWEVTFTTAEGKTLKREFDESGREVKD
jgi:hypothetical protein